MENLHVNAVKVDDARRLRLTMLTPGDYYAPEIQDDGEIILHKVLPPQPKFTKAEILSALDKSPIKFTASWDELKKEVR